MELLNMQIVASFLGSSSMENNIILKDMPPRKYILEMEMNESDCYKIN